MALGRISGEMLKSNLEREGVDLAIDTDLLYVDVSNNRIGVNTSTPDVELHVDGDIKADNLEVTGTLIVGASAVQNLDTGNIRLAGNTISTTNTDGNLILSPNGDGLVVIAANDGGAKGIEVATPETEQVAWSKFANSTDVTTAINDLNQTSLNIAKGTYVGDLNFSASREMGPSPLTVTFTPTYVGNPTNFEWTFSDGTVSYDESPVKTFENENGGLYSVSFKAYNANGTYNGDGTSGAVGSWDDVAKTDYITLYTPLPIPDFTLNKNILDSGDVVTATNTSQYSSSYTFTWGDGANNSLGDGWTTIQHTYNNVGGDTKYTLTLDGTSQTAGETPQTETSDEANVFVYSTHSPTFTTDVIRVVNEEATNGGVVTFFNNTTTDPGDTTMFSSNRYEWTYGDGDSDVINISSGVGGNPGTPLAHTYTLTSSEQASGVTVSRTASLKVINRHTSSPFVSSPVTIFVEPDVRANVNATAVTTSDRDGDTDHTLYDFVDYNGNNRALVRVLNTSQNADEYIYNWGDSSTPETVPENGVSAGTVSNPILHDYSDEALGTRTLNFYASGTPDTIAQNDSDSVAFILTQAPGAPSGLSTHTITVSNDFEGINPALAADFIDSSSSSSLTPGTRLDLDDAKRIVTQGVVETNTVNNVYDGTKGTLTSIVNGANAGSRTFTTALNQTGTSGSLVITEQADAHDTVSSSTYPTGFYQTFDAKITRNLSQYNLGVNDQKLSHSNTGDTNTVFVVKDDLTLIPTINTSLSTIEEAGASYRYVSGIPYYAGGSNITVTDVSVTNWISQTYADVSTPLYIATHTNYEGTSGEVIAQQDKTYSDIDGSTTFLSNGVPKANSGYSTPYTFGDIGIEINGDVVDACASLGVRLTNVNGNSLFTEIPVKVQVYREGNGFDETAIPVSDSLGLDYDDDGRRIVMTGDDRPSYSALDFFSLSSFSGYMPIEGTNEAIVRWGRLEHNNDIDLSTGYMPQGPDLITGRAGAQYFTFAFRRTNVSNFDITFTGRISGMWMAAPGTGIDISSASTNGWVNCSEVYGGSGLPGDNVAYDGNGVDGCAVTTIDKIPLDIDVDNGTYSLTLGNENMSNATGNNVLIRIRLENGDYINSMSIGVAS